VADSYYRLRLYHNITNSQFLLAAVFWYWL